MRDKWNQDFFWTLDITTNTWTQQERMLILDSDGSSVFTMISGATSGTTISGSTS